MVKNKLFKFVILTCAIISNKPAQAFWPVMDFGEVPQVVSSFTTASSSLKENIGQLTELKDAVKAMGDSIDNLAQFGQDLRSTVTNIKDVATDTVDGVNENLGTDIEIPESVNNGFEMTDNALGDGLNGVINDTQNALSTGENLIDKGNSGIVSFENTAKKADEGMKKLEAKNEAEKAKREQKKQEQQKTEPVEEEEEEEEIPDTSVSDSQEDIMANLEAFEEDSKQIIARMNDVLDTSISTLNKSAKSTDKILENLEQAVKETEQLAQSDKDILVKKIADLRAKQQNLSDKNIALIENAKENYNQECQSKLLDGISNYKKVIEGYFRGDVAKKDVIKQGEDLKIAVAQINASIDKQAIAEQRKEIDKIKAEMQAIASEINTKKKLE